MTHRQQHKTMPRRLRRNSGIRKMDNCESITRWRTIQRPFSAAKPTVSLGRGSVFPRRGQASRPGVSGHIKTLDKFHEE
jgi:hypothetical protein